MHIPFPSVAFKTKGVGREIMTLLLVFSFLAGFCTIISPCVLPVLPIILASSASKGRLRPFGVVLGLIVSFTIFTLTLTALV